MKFQNSSLQEIVDKTLEKVKTFNSRILLPALREADKEPFKDELWDGPMNINGCALYVFSTCLVDLLRPTQVVELGGAMGMWSLCVLHSLPENSKLYSITLPEDGLDFKFVVDKYENFYPVRGDDLNLNNWPKDLDLGKTDIWYIDTIHEYDQVVKELNLYKQFFKKGALLLFDDIHLNLGMESIWKEIQDQYESIDITDPCHYTGWGISKV